jgi:hypothetical protein
MNLKEIFKVVLSIVMTVFILSVSMGMNISKMNCDKNGSVYLGTQVPSCSEKNEVVCNKEQEKVTCCMIEVQKSCCPETNDESCASSTQNIHYDFETILTVFEHDFSAKASSLSFFNSYDSKSYFVKVNNYFSGIPPPKLNKPELSQIQSLLL